MTNLNIETITLGREAAYGHEFAQATFYFNGRYLKFTVADSFVWFGDNPNKTYELWPAFTMLAAGGDGMKEAIVISNNIDLVRICSSLGNFNLRRVSSTDVLQYGINNYDGAFVEPVK